MLVCMKHMDMEKIMRSGECFRLSGNGEGEYRLVAFGRVLKIWQPPELLRMGSAEFGCGAEELSELWLSYFDYDTDYDAVAGLIDPSDAYLRHALDSGSGIRILRQELWETIVSFLISQNNNIPRIRKSIEAFCRRFGEKIEYEGEEYYSFPGPERLTGVEKTDLAGLSLGYRDGYIAEAVKAVKDGRLDLEKLRSASYEEALALLKQQKGIGQKVADCVCLFGLHHTEAFPMDTHMNRVLEEHYPGGFPAERYGKAAGILQQYMFYTELTEGKKKKNA